MSTPNFSKKNASKYFVLDPQDDLEWEMMKENLDYTFEKSGYDSTEQFVGRNSVLIARKTIIKQTATFEPVISINVILRSGYYQGANLDWEIEGEFGFYGMNSPRVDTPDIEDVLYHDTHFNRGMAKIQAPHISYFMESSAEDLIIETEKLFEKMTTPYVKTAQFSNGEAMYAKAN